MNQEEQRKKYLVFSVVALAALIVGAVSISSSSTAVSTNGLSDAKITQDKTDHIDTNDGKSVSDGDGETNDDTNDATK